MKKDPNITKSKENFDINEQKQYQRKVKTVQVEQQTQIKEGKKRPVEEKIRQIHPDFM